MCKNHSKKRCCLNPEQGKVDPGHCSPEKIKECHGSEKHHPCEDVKKGDCRK